MVSLSRNSDRIQVLTWSFRTDIGADDQMLIDAFTTLQIVLPLLPPSLHDMIAVLIPGIIASIKSPFAVIRSAAGRALATVCRVIPQQGMSVVLDEIVPALGDSLDLSHRRGAIEGIWCESNLDTHCRKAPC